MVLRAVLGIQKGSANSITRWDPDFYGYAFDDLHSNSENYFRRDPPIVGKAKNASEKPLSGGDHPITRRVKLQ